VTGDVFRKTFKSLVFKYLILWAYLDNINIKYDNVHQTHQVLFYIQATCFDLYEVIIRPFVWIT